MSGTRDKTLRWVWWERTERSRNTRPSDGRSQSKLGHPTYRVVSKTVREICVVIRWIPLNPNPLRRERPRRDPTPRSRGDARRRRFTLQRSAALAKRPTFDPSLLRVLRRFGLPLAWPALVKSQKDESYSRGLGFPLHPRALDRGVCGGNPQFQRRFAVSSCL